MKLLITLWNSFAAIYNFLLVSLWVVLLISAAIAILGIICIAPVALILGYIDLVKMIWHHF